MADERRTSPMRNSDSNVFGAVKVARYAEREREFVQVKSVTYSPLTDCCYNQRWVIVNLEVIN